VEDFLKNAIEHCDQLREDKTCKFKNDIKKQHCTINPNMCCAMCEECEVNCDAKIGICTWLF
jgi:hypothetical protein